MKRKVALFIEPVCSFILPVGYFLVLKNTNMRFGLICLAVQIICTVAFYMARPLWASYLIRYTERFDSLSRTAITEKMGDFFFTLMIVLFGYLFPHAFYLQRPMSLTMIILALLFCLALLGHRFDFLPEGAARRRYLPFLTLTGIAVSVISFPVSNPSLVVLLLLGLYCLEITTSLVWQIAGERREREDQS